MFWQPCTQSEHGIIWYMCFRWSIMPDDYQRVPYTDSMMRARYLRGDSVPEGWLGWDSTKQWLADTVLWEQLTVKNVA